MPHSMVIVRIYIIIIIFIIFITILIYNIITITIIIIIWIWADEKRYKQISRTHLYYSQWRIKELTHFWY